MLVDYEWITEVCSAGCRAEGDVHFCTNQSPHPKLGRWEKHTHTHTQNGNFITLPFS